MSLATEIHNVEFDCPFTIVNGEIVDMYHDHIAPSVYVEEITEDSFSEPLIESDEWKFVSDGFTGQYGYNGPIMHSSEFIGNAIASYLQEIAEDYVCFAIVVVETINLDSDCDNEPAGWAIVGKSKP